DPGLGWEAVRPAIRQGLATVGGARLDRVAGDLLGGLSIAHKKAIATLQVILTQQDFLIAVRLSADADRLILRAAREWPRVQRRSPG
ncbi:MAG: hypothetical protein ACI9HE_001524, partial [Planctomycetota bacterium]